MAQPNQEQRISMDAELSERLEFAIGAADIGFWEVDIQTNVVKWDGRCQELFGLTKDYFIPYSEAIQHIHADDLDLQQFAHVTSHDLKEPLRKIKTFLSRIVEDADNRYSVKSGGHLSKIKDSAERMQSMIDGILSYSRINGNSQKVEEVNVSALFSSAVIDVRSLMIIRNGIVFFRIEFADNGIGFDQVYAEKVFTTFTRLHPKDRYEGAGLGLALCKKIVGRHHGWIEAFGEVGKGATFVVFLPATQPRPLL